LKGFQRQARLFSASGLKGEVTERGAIPFMRLLRNFRVPAGRLGFSVALAMVALGASILLAAPVQAQKVKYNYDKTVDFAHYKRYAWAKNYILTRQRPDDQKSIAESVKSAINSQLAAKGFILDEQHPDFLVSYEAGGMTKSDISAVPDLSRNQGDPNAIDQPAFATPMNASDAWVSVLAGVRVTIQDAGTTKAVWIGQLSEKVKDPQNVMPTVDKEVSKAMAKLFTPFPPGSKSK
jgi:hypothetical protein